MAKKLVRKLNLLPIEAGRATPAPPLGPALGQAKVNIGEFVTKFNAATQAMKGEKIPVTVFIYEDKTFELILKKPLASALIKKAAGIEKGSGKNATSKVGSITKAQLKELAEKKLPDLNATTVEAGMKVLEGTARSMGVEVK